MRARIPACPWTKLLVTSYSTGDAGSSPAHVISYAHSPCSVLTKMSGETPSRCVYALPKNLDPLDRLPSNRGRSSAVHNLIRAFGLTHTASTDHHPGYPRARILSTGLASPAELEAFHDPEYIGSSPLCPSSLPSSSSFFLYNPLASLLSGYDSNDGINDDQCSDLQHAPMKDFSCSNVVDREEFGLEHVCTASPSLSRTSLMEL